MVEYNVVPFGTEGLRPFCNGSVEQSVHPIRRNLGNKQFSDQGQALVERRIDSGDDHQEQKQQHKVDLTGQD